MTRRFPFRWLLPVVGMIAGLAVGGLARNSARPAPSRSDRPPSAPSWPPPKPGSWAASSPAVLFDRFRSAGTNTLQRRIKLEQLILSMTANEARDRLGSASSADDERLRGLLYYRAADGDPGRMMRESQARGVSDPVSFLGIFRAWVRMDPIEALTHAENAGGHWLPACVRAWAELDPAACAQALTGRELSGEVLWNLTSAWVSRDPEGALAWVNNSAGPQWQAFANNLPNNEGYIRPEMTDQEKASACLDSVKMSLFTAWVRGDPVAGFRAVVATDWGRPHSVASPGASWNRPDDWFANAFSTLAQISPEMAARLASALPQDRLTEGIASFIASPLEAAAPEAGVVFARGLPPGLERDAAFGACAFVAAARGDFNRASEWVDSIDDPTKRAVAAVGVLNARVPMDPQGAREWLPSLTSSLPPELARFVTDSLNDYHRRE